jgi:hypothetical protein
VLTVVTERDALFDAEWRMTDSRSGGKSLRDLEFNDLNINLYLTLYYIMASEHL